MFLKNSFFSFMDEAELRLIRAYPEHTDVFERAADACKPLFGYEITEQKPSTLLVQALFRINLNYLIGSYKAFLQAIPSFAYSGMRNVFEGIIRGYYYMVNEESATASYLYISTQGGKKSPIIEEIDIEIMKRVLDQIKDDQLIRLCTKIIGKESFSKDDIITVTNFDKPSRSIKQNISKLYTKSVQKNLRSIWSEFSRFSHSGFKTRYEDLQLPENRIPIYGKHFLSLLLLLSANILMYLEVVDPTMIDTQFLGEIFRLTEYYPVYYPNKNEYQNRFTFTSQQAIDKLIYT
ncbi:MAG: hypothetical protein ACTSW1_09615 [Candidatus Hodarchaeales archaeon]